MKTELSPQDWSFSRGLSHVGTEVGWESTIIRNRTFHGTSLAVQWLRLCASTARGVGSIPGRGTKIPYAARCDQKKKKGGGKETGLSSLLLLCVSFHLAFKKRNKKKPQKWSFADSFLDKPAGCVLFPYKCSILFKSLPRKKRLNRKWRVYSGLYIGQGFCFVLF